MDTNQPLNPSPFPEIPPPTYPDLSLPALAQLARQEWHNPVIRRLWPKVRKWAWAPIAFGVLALLQSFGAMWIFESIALGTATSSAPFFALQILSALLALIFLLALLILPYRYAGWAVRHAYLQDPHLRTSTLTCRNWTIGIILPALAIPVLLTLATIPSTVLLPFSVARVPYSPESFGGTPLAIVSAISGCLDLLPSFVALSCLVATIILRRTITLFHGLPPRRSAFKYFATPYALAFALFCIQSLLAYFTIGTAEAACYIQIAKLSTAAAPPAPPLKEIHWLMAAYAATPLLDLALIALALSFYRKLWHHDIPLARAHTFKALEE